jgi:peptidoglycan LD-endopeptidase LytH
MTLEQILIENKASFKPVVTFNKLQDKVFNINLSAAGLNVPEPLSQANNSLNTWLYNFLETNNYKYAVGGYNELRLAYGKSALFGNEQKARRLHIGVDVFAPAGTEIFLPIDGHIHSFANNSTYGDYGPTIIFKHSLQNFSFHTLYGHNSLANLALWQNMQGTNIEAGTLIGHMGTEVENVGWSPHLHFQIIVDMQGKTGDYFGVCAAQEAAYYLSNCPDPNLILGML